MHDEFFRNPERAGVYGASADRAEAAATGAERAGLQVLAADVDALGDLPAVLAELGRAWHFPDWYGGNLDALYDCLIDPDWLGTTGKLLALGGLERFRDSATADFRTLLEVLGAAADLARRDGIPLWIVLDVTEPGIAALPAR